MKLTIKGWRKCEHVDCSLEAIQSVTRHGETIYFCLAHIRRVFEYEWLFGDDYIIKQMTSDEMMPDE